MGRPYPLDAGAPTDRGKTGTGMEGMPGKNGKGKKGPAAGKGSAGGHTRLHDPKWGPEYQHVSGRVTGTSGGPRLEVDLFVPGSYRTATCRSVRFRDTAAVVEDGVTSGLNALRAPHGAPPGSWGSSQRAAANRSPRSSRTWRVIGCRALARPRCRWSGTRSSRTWRVTGCHALARPRCSARHVSEQHLEDDWASGAPVASPPPGLKHARCVGAFRAWLASPTPRAAAAPPRPVTGADASAGGASLTWPAWPSWIPGSKTTCAPASSGTSRPRVGRQGARP